jgi:TonB family protein
MHAVIEIDGDAARIVDLGSGSGTLLAGTPVDKSARLTPGDALTVGPYRIEVLSLRVGGAAGLASVPAMATPSLAADVAARPHVSSHAQVPVDLSKVETQDGTQVAEVVAMYGRSVLDVAHVGQVSTKRRRNAPALVAAGACLVLGGIGLFSYESTQDWQGYSAQARNAQETGMSAPSKPGLGTGPLGLGLALCGLIPCVAGGMRLRERTRDEYTLGEAPEASFQVAGATLPVADEFPIVRKSGEQFSLCFSDSMRGEIEIGEQRLELSELIATGRTGRTQMGAHEYPLAPGARAIVRHGDLSFHVASVNPGAVVAGRGKADWPFWSYVGGTGVVAMSLWMLARSVPAPAFGIAMDDDTGESRFARYMHQADLVEEEPPVPPVKDSISDDPGGQGERHAGEEGQQGKPTSKKTDGYYQIKGPKNATAQMARDFDPTMEARDFGILGIMEKQSGHFLASPYGGAFAMGSDDEDLWGNITGTQAGEAYGVGGLGLVGTGRGGGGMGAGTIGLGTVGTIGHGAGGGKGVGYGTGNGVGFGKRTGKKVRVRAAVAKVRGSIDKDTIRRIVRAHINEVRSCYNQGLVSNPNLAGRVAIQFVIIPTGKVGSAAVQENSTKNSNVGNCIAKAVKRWKFPRPQNGGNVIVSYPFQLTAA